MPRTPPSTIATQPSTPHPLSTHQSHRTKPTQQTSRPVSSQSNDKEYIEPTSRRFQPHPYASNNTMISGGGGGGGFKKGVMVDILSDAVAPSSTKIREDALKGKVERSPLGDAVSARSNSNTSSPGNIRSGKGGVVGVGVGVVGVETKVIDSSMEEKRISKPIPSPHPRVFSRETNTRDDSAISSRGGHVVSSSVSTIVPTTCQTPITPPRQTLARPKSRLRLRLKLTPPHPPGTRTMEVPNRPIPIRPKAFGGPSPPPSKVETTHTGSGVSDDEVIAGKDYHYIKQQSSISTLNEHVFTRTSDIAASEADARTAKAMQQSSALSLIAGNPSIQTRIVSGPARGTHANRPPPPAASQKKRETTMVKRMLSADGLRGRAMEMGRIMLGGNSSRENLLSVPNVGPTGKVKGSEMTGEDVQVHSKVDIPRSERSWNLKDLTDVPTTASPNSTQPSTATSTTSLTANNLITKTNDSRGESLASVSISASSTRSYMDLSMTMSNPSQSSVHKDLIDSEQLDENLLQASGNSSSEAMTAVASLDDPATPRHIRITPNDSLISQDLVDEDTFYPASDSTPVKSGRSAAQSFRLDTSPRGDSSMWTDSSMKQSHLGKADTSVTHVPSVNSSPFRYDNREQSMTISQEDAANSSCVTHTTVSTDPSSSRQDDRERDGSREGDKGKGEMATDIFSLSDQMLSDRYKFVEEIGFGNWGSVWVCKPRQAQYHPLHRLTQQHLPAMSAGQIIASQHHHSRIAVKLVHRAKTPTTAARVRALWSEMKVIRTLRSDPHPSVVAFDSFIITPSYALIVMPYYAQLIPVNISEDRARSYFKQLASAVAYLHDKGITHNDLKPSNILLSHADIPVLVDFGFATKWDLAEIDLTGCGDVSLVHSPLKKEPFFSEISWGTPEYLDPPRARGIKHDERLSDVWSLGVTFFEILSGRTPFEISEEEEFATPEQLKVYYERTLTGVWIGDWRMSKPMEILLKGMIQPNHAKRLTASKVYHHYALSPAASPGITTPPFVRSAASMSHMSSKDANRNKAKKEKKAKDRLDARPEPASSAADKPKDQTLTEAVVDPVTAAPAQSARTIRRIEVANNTPKETKPLEVTKPNASPLQESTSSRLNVTRILSPSHKELVPVVLEGKVADTKVSQVNITVRKQHHRKPSQHVPDHAQADPEAPAEATTKIPEAKTEQPTASTIVRMKSIVELKRVTSREVILGMMDVKASRPVSASEARSFAENQRVSQIEPITRSIQADKDSKVLYDQAVNISNPRFAELREKIVHNDQANAVRYRTTSGSLTRPTTGVTSESAVAGSSESAVTALDSRLDRIASWVKNVERIVEDARLTLSDVQQEQSMIPCSTVAIPLRESVNLDRRRSDMKDDATHIRPAEHSRNVSALSTKVEPATPPKWTGQEKNVEQATSAPFGYFKPSHLKRQRSDLTGIRSKTFASVVEEHTRPRPQTPVILGAISHEPLLVHVDESKHGRKLRSHRSLGDISRLVEYSEDPYDCLLAERDGVLRYGEGYTGMQGEAGFARLASGPFKSKSGVFGGLFHKKESQITTGLSAPVSSSRFKGLVNSMKTAFGRH